MKKLLIIILLLIAIPAHGQMTVKQGGTGTSTAPQGQILFGGPVSGLVNRITSSVDLIWNNTVKRLTMPYASTTAISSSYASSTVLRAGSGLVNNTFDVLGNLSFGTITSGGLFSSCASTVGYMYYDYGTHEVTCVPDPASGSGTGWASSTAPTSIYFTGSSNVGIGTSSPYAKLSVVGQIVGAYLTATSTTATSSLQNTSVGQLKIDNLTGVLTGTSGFVSGTNLSTDQILVGTASGFTTATKNTANGWVGTDANNNITGYSMIPRTSSTSDIATIVLDEGELAVATGTPGSFTQPTLRFGDGVTAGGFIVNPWDFASSTGNINYSRGKVGVGTSSPGAALSVQGNTDSLPVLYVNGGTAASGLGQGIILQGGTGAGSNGANPIRIIGGNAGASIPSANGGSIYLKPGVPKGATLGVANVILGMDVDNTSQGNTGVSSSSPSRTLSVQGTAYISGNTFNGGTITSTSSSASTFPYASTTALTSTGSAFFATAGGKVGIGTTAPTKLLHLNNTTDASGYMFKMTGLARDTSSDTAEGVALMMEHNASGNRQFALIDSETGNGVRVLGYGLDAFNGITGSRADMTLGTDTTDVTVNRNLIVTNKTTTAYSSTTASATVSGATFLSTASGKTSIGTTTQSLGKLNTQGNGTGTGINFATANSAGTPKTVILDNGNIGVGWSDPSTINAPITFGQDLGLKFNLYATAAYGIGVQANTMIFAVDPSGGGNNFDFSDLTTSGRTTYMRLVTTSGNLGIGTTSPWAGLSVQKFNSAQTPSFEVATSSGNPVFRVLGNGHISTHGTPLTTANLSSCLTSPTVFGTDVSFHLYVGSGLGGTCTVTFNSPFTVAPICSVTQEAGTATAFTASSTPTTLLITNSSMASKRYAVLCVEPNSDH